MQTLFRSTLMIVMILAALLVPGVTTAQEPPSGCTPELLAERFAAIQDDIAQAEARLSDNDTAGALDAFNAAAALMDEVRATCGTNTATITVEPGIPVGPVVPVPPTSMLCNDYPQYCVPFVGRADGRRYSQRSARCAPGPVGTVECSPHCARRDAGGRSFHWQS